MEHPQNVRSNNHGESTGKNIERTKKINMGVKGVHYCLEINAIAREFTTMAISLFKFVFLSKRDCYIFASAYPRNDN
jgi:hypothetical protein